MLSPKGCWSLPSTHLHAIDPVTLEIGMVGLKELIDAVNGHHSEPFLVELWLHLREGMENEGCADQTPAQNR